MVSYQFRYVSASGKLIRSTVMQCGADAEAVRKAREAMRVEYAVLEVLDGDRIVYRSNCTSSASEVAV